MVYEVIEVDEVARDHFVKVQVFVSEKIHKQLENPHIEKLWRDKIGPHDFLYNAHIKTGHFGSHHHYTVLWEVKGHHGEHVRLIDVQEGHKTLF